MHHGAAAVSAWVFIVWGTEQLNVGRYAIFRQCHVDFRSLGGKTCVNIILVTFKSSSLEIPQSASIESPFSAAPQSSERDIHTVHMSQ